MQESSELDEEVWQAINAFEQIIEALPRDRASLEALSHAYEQVGDTAKEAEYLNRLAKVLIDEEDADAAARLQAMSSARSDTCPSSSVRANTDHPCGYACRKGPSQAGSPTRLIPSARRVES